MTPDNEQGNTSDATRAEDELDARTTAAADRAPTPEEEAEADGHGKVSDSVAAHEEDMMERGANAKGEGEI